MSNIRKELLYLILQFLDEEGFKETAHKLQCETGSYFDMEYFEALVLDGKWDDVERYLSGFTKVDDNWHSTKIYMELRKHKFLEALNINDRAKALDILIKDLKVFSPGNDEFFKEMTQLLTINNIREHESHSNYGDANSMRKIVVDGLKKLIEQNPIFDGKLKFPAIINRRLTRLLEQSLNWQHLCCTYPAPNPVIQTLLVDHVCIPCLNPSSQQLEENGPFEMFVSHLSSSRNPNPFFVFDSALLPADLTNPKIAVKVPEDPNVIFKGSPSQASNEGTSALANDLPEKVFQTLKEESPPISMDFHPTSHTVLLVGTQVGNIGLWDVNSGEKLFSRNFRVWEIGACSTNFKVAMEKDLCVSVKRIIWSLDGSLFGVAFSDHIVQLYSYHGHNCIGQHLEIAAHDGSVNDLAFSSISQQLFVITCGDDMTIKVWDAVTGIKRCTFEGHNAPVFSICPHVKERVDFIFSTSIDGKIKAWLYFTLGPRIEFDAPGNGYTKLAYSADDQRLFLGGSDKDGGPYLVEWDETEGCVKRSYNGLKKPCLSTIQFDSTQNRLLAAGDDHKVKFWNMDDVELWKSTDVDGESPENPCICFNKEGSLLAVAAKDNKIKILANYEILLKWREIHSVHASSVLHETMGKNGCQKGSTDTRSNSTEESCNESKMWNAPEFYKPSQCQFLQLYVHSKVNNKIVRLTYTNAGNGILALTSNGTHLLWKWPYNNLHLDDKATARVSPHIWQPKSGLQLMINDLTSVNSEDQVSCFVLSNNDSYLMSTSGGKISLFYMLTFKALTTIMPPPPRATCLAFYPPNNNIVAIGMDNSSIRIYNVRANKILSELVGHSKRVTALAFSSSFNVLVSGDVNAQIFVWNANGWGKQKDRYLQIHGQKVPEVLSETHIQFHPDHTLFLAVHNTHLAIYEATELKCVKQWVPEVSVVISQATFSSDGQIVYASFVDGTLAIFDALNFQIHCRINRSAYLFPTPSSNIYPLAIAAHPQKPTQFAVGLTDGRVYVFEPLKQGGDWSMFPLDDKDEGASEHQGNGRSVV